MPAKETVQLTRTQMLTGSPRGLRNAAFTDVWSEWRVDPQTVTWGALAQLRPRQSSCRRAAARAALSAVPASRAIEAARAASCAAASTASSATATRPATPATISSARNAGASTATSTDTDPRVRSAARRADRAAVDRPVGTAARSLRAARPVSTPRQVRRGGSAVTGRSTVRRCRGRSAARRTGRPG